MAQAMKIAIVDDEKDMRQSISQWLALSGFDTETFASAADVKRFVASRPGAIAFILARELDSTVKAVTIEGRRPADAGYVLRD